jgi:hypothetical protein
MMGQKNTGGMGMMTAKVVVRGPDGKAKGHTTLRGPVTDEQYKKIQKLHKGKEQK